MIVLASLFIERSIKNALDFFKEAIFSDDIASSKGLLQSIGPKFKISLLFLSLVAVLLARTVPALLALYAISIVLAALSGINVFFFVKRVLVFMPIFTLFIAIPAFFMQGPEHAFIFVMRVTDCVSFAVLMTITTRHSKLLKALGSIGVPAIFVSTLDMTYRYVFLFIKVFEEMHLGLKARLVKRMGAGQARHWIASRAAHLFKRSLKMSEDVYMAMVARGYTMERKRYGR